MNILIFALRSGREELEWTRDQGTRWRNLMHFKNIMLNEGSWNADDKTKNVWNNVSKCIKKIAKDILGELRVMNCLERKVGGGRSSTSNQIEEVSCRDLQVWKWEILEK